MLRNWTGSYLRSTYATFEEHINGTMRAKRDLADLTVGSGEQWISNLPGEELRELFALG